MLRVVPPLCRYARGERSEVTMAMAVGGARGCGGRGRGGGARIKTERASSAGRGRKDPLDVSGPRGIFARSHLGLAFRTPARPATTSEIGSAVTIRRVASQ